MRGRERERERVSVRVSVCVCLLETVMRKGNCVLVVSVFEKVYLKEHCGKLM